MFSINGVEHLECGFPLFVKYNYIYALHAPRTLEFCSMRIVMLFNNALTRVRRRWW
jgi:hypothetical protein